MVKRILAVCYISLNDFKAIVMSIDIRIKYKLQIQYIAAENVQNCVIQAFQVVCSFFDL